MSADTAARRDRLRDLLPDRDADAALITDLLNIRYLTGFTGSNAALLVRAAGPDVFCTDARYRTQAGVQVPDLEHVIERECADALAQVAAGDALARVAYETHVVSVDGLAALREVLPGDILRSLARAVEQLRLVKDDAEIALLRAACAVADRALADLLSAGGLRAGRSELEVARDLEGRMLEHGASRPSFETIVATGPHSAVPHHRPTDRRLATGDFVKIDFGATVGGYHSDMTRTMVLGVPAAWQEEVYDLVHAAQAAGCAAAVVGADVREVDAAARDLIAAAGYGEAFGHGLGHGIGLDVHEAPALSVRGVGTLADRTPVTVEPGVYLEGRGGVRIEDLLVVRTDGPDLLTTTDKALLVV